MILQGAIPRQEGGAYIRLVSLDWGNGHTVKLNSSRILEFLDEEGAIRYVELPGNLHMPKEGDVLRIDLSCGTVRFLYRRDSPHNALFITERCNSRCLMCSQPPRVVDDGYLIDDILEMLPLISRDTVEIGITGGEPTLLGPRLLQVIQNLKLHLPRTAVHMLTNGRSFSSEVWAKDIAAIHHPDLMLGIPLYSDVAWRHDFIVQASGAFDETLRGFFNLARHNVPFEIRVVIHMQSLPRLRELALFISRNLPFAKQVALMGLELMGFARTNIDSLWVEPQEYGEILRDAIGELTSRGVNPLIFNHPLCLLPHELWPFAVKSISDWKNVYAEECDACVVRNDCGGLFASSALRRPAGLRAIETLPPSHRQFPAFAPTNP